MSATVGVPASITTPDQVPSRLGTLEFSDGAPTPDTAERLYDNLDFMRGVEAYLNSIQGGPWSPCGGGSRASASRTTRS